MRSTLPERLKLPWDLKENLSARSGVDELSDGRTKYWVDEILKGITPKMFVWWFSGGLIGKMNIDGRPVSRYRVWHPYDHVQARALTNRPYEAKEGAIAELEEYFGRNPEYYTNPAVRIDRIDEEVVTTTWFENGIAVGHLDHELEAVPAGMRLGHVMYVLASCWRPVCGPGPWGRRGSSTALRRWPTSRISSRSSTNAKRTVRPRDRRCRNQPRTVGPPRSECHETP